MSEAQTERRVPEHPGWRPHWLRYAAVGRARVVLLDASAPTVCSRMGTIQVPAPTRYAVAGVLPGESEPPPCECGDLHHWTIRFTDSLPAAEAAFELACERLREGG